MKRGLFVFLALLALLPSSGWAAGRDTYTVIISLDGLRWDYLDAYDVPFLNIMAREGVKAVMQPSFPSKTFPNHYTLATGLTPDHHGIIANTFWDRERGVKFSLSNDKTRSDGRYYGGDPIWLTAKHQGVKTATVFWVGSDVAIKGEHPTYWHDYQTEKIDFPGRMDEIIRLLSLPEKDRPHLVMAYFEEPDASGHNFGPLNILTRRALEDLDRQLSLLWARIGLLPIAGQVNFIVTGDHGMTSVDPKRFVNINDVLPKRWYERFCNDYPTLIYASAPQYIDSICDALQGVDHIRAWKRGEVPAYLGYGNNPNMGDVIVLPDVGWLFDKKPSMTQFGSHGFDHTAADMQVGFRAVGPDFKVGYEKPDRFRNVCIYPLLCHLLGVTPSPNDGSLEEVADLLR
ncbi:MAG: alkaline phosphatase family protein [Muribaculaceae bacterium]|nr:alkaline phosphatase family protein [Muribaculaceae bacterium]